MERGVGANCHMGSGGSAVRELMRSILRHTRCSGLALRSRGCPGFSGSHDRSAGRRLTHSCFLWLESGGPAAIPARTVWGAPTGRVVEALLWPLIVQHCLVAARTIGEACSDVVARKAPVAVE